MSVRSARLIVAALAAVLVGVSTVRADEPLMILGHSGDAWDTPFDVEERAWASCINLVDGYSIPVVEKSRGPAVSRLASTAYIPLKDADVARLSGLPVTRGKSAAAAFFERQIRDQEAVRDQVMATKVGSWSGWEQFRLDEMRGIVAGDRLARFRPYLARTLINPVPDSVMRVDVCEGILRLTNVSTGVTTLTPRRGALVVFLEAPPKEVIVRWAVYDDPATREH